MGANIAGIYGAQIFRQDDRPFYRRGFSINIAILAAGLSLAIIRYIADIIERRKKRNQVQLHPDSVSDEVEVDKGVATSVQGFDLGPNGEKVSSRL